MQRVAMRCNTLQYTATHCNTLQHTATRCNTLQHTATTRGNALQHAAPCCNTLQRIATHCNALQHTRTYCNTLQITATHHARMESPETETKAFATHSKEGSCNTLQRIATHCNTLLHTATHCRTRNKGFCKPHTHFLFFSFLRVCAGSHVSFVCVPLTNEIRIQLFGSRDQNPMHRTTTHCNTQLHTVTHCNTPCERRDSRNRNKGCC